LIVKLLQWIRSLTQPVETPVKPVKKVEIQARARVAIEPPPRPKAHARTR